MFKTIRIGPQTYRVCLRTARKSCEHFCFIGASVDAYAYTLGYHAGVFALLGKFAFASGGLGVYLLHLEERVFRAQ